MATIGAKLGVAGSGWVRIVDVIVPLGVADNKVFQDAPNDTILQSCRISHVGIQVLVKASYPIVSSGPTTAVLIEDPTGGYYQGIIPLTVSGSGPVSVTVHTPDNLEGVADSIDLTYDAPPTLLSLIFVGGYPGSQTELKAGDTFQLQGTTNKPANAIEIMDFGAMVNSVQTFITGTSFTVTGTIADRGNVPQLLSAQARARGLSGAYGNYLDTNISAANIDGTTVLNLNNLYPSVLFGSITYPVSQGALKNSEQATIPFSMANADSVAFTSPTGQLSIDNPTTSEPNKTVQRISGNYNDSTNNLKAEATRDANDASSSVEALIKIAHVAATITITNPATRLRSGGNNGTAAQLHSITLTANQELYAAPTLDEAIGGGTFSGSWSGGPKIYTRNLSVHDNDNKGVYSYINLSAVNLAGLITTIITGSSNYTLGGFIQRNLTFPAFSQNAVLGSEVITYSKLKASFFTATNQPALTTATQGDTSNLSNRFTVLTLGTLPTTLFWNDVTASLTNSSGTAQIVNVEEEV